MPVARYNACEITWHRCEQPVVAVCVVAPDATIVPVLTDGVPSTGGLPNIVSLGYLLCVTVVYIFVWLYKWCSVDM